jgi:hypothetical protein
MALVLSWSEYADYIRLVVLTIFYVTIIYLMRTGITLINFYTPLNVPMGINIVKTTSLI